MSEEEIHLSSLEESQKILKDKFRNVANKFHKEVLFPEIPVENLTEKEIEQYENKQEILFELRDAFFYRQDSLIFHFNLLNEIQDNTKSKFNLDLSSRGKDSLLKASAFQQEFIFDDILFNTMSLFDYFGNFVGYIFFGEEGKKYRWKRLLNHCKKPKKEEIGKERKRLINSKIRSQLQENHIYWVQHLNSHRSEIIHYKVDEINGELSYSIPIQGKSLPKEDSQIKVFVPEDFAQKFNLGDTEELSLIQATAWLMSKSSKIIVSMLEALEEDIANFEL
ncbi:hypothetical protein [Rhodohalobacter sp. 614A]|uniref:hypothetical protein n=1 Tax=Rhodohalobacter sp. 614A TaxID=2908649 RepID=UPI001F2A73AB|nr:hypothetical protein [Rhodohalobacter sp. 614A]